MGKGDIKSKRGKIANGSFGKKRKQRLAKTTNGVVKTAKSRKVSSDVDTEVKKTKKTTKRTAKKTTEEKGEE